MTDQLQMSSQLTGSFSGPPLWLPVDEDGSLGLDTHWDLVNLLVRVQQIALSFL